MKEQNQEQINSVLSKITNIDSVELSVKQNKEKNEPTNSLSVNDIEESLKKMNPELAKFLVIETLENKYINDRHGAFPKSSTHRIKDLIEQKYTDFQKINDPVQQLESLSLDLIHSKVREKIQFELNLEQSSFINNILDKRLNSFNLLRSIINNQT